MAALRSTNNPLMLKWAREEIGYSLEQASAALGIKAVILEAAEAGEKALTLNQLRKAAEKYCCPLGYFYLTKPPYKHTNQTVPDYRIDPDMHGSDHYRLQFEIKKARDQRAVFLEILASLDEPKRRFSTLKRYDPKSIGGEIRKRLDVNEQELANCKLDKVYSYWKKKIENDNVLVFESMYIPNETGVIGLAIYYDHYPIILVKRGGNSNLRKLFTLIHEYAHLLKGESAINDARSLTVRNGDSEIRGLEIECNKLAAEILVPPEMVKKAEYNDLTASEQMLKLSERFKVTYSTAAVCLRQRNFISKKEFNELLELRRLARESKLTTSNREVRIPRETIQRIDLGRPMFSAVINAYEAGHLDVFDASKILNLKVKKIDSLLERVDS